VSEFEPLQPFDLDAIDVGEPEPLAAERPGAGFTAPPAPPAIPSAPPPPPVATTTTTTTTPPPPTPSPDAGALDTGWHTAAQGPAPTPPPGSDPWASVPRTNPPAPQVADEVPVPSPVLRPAPTGEVYRSGASIDVVPAERSTPVEERVVRQSVRYDEPVEKAPSYMASVVAADIAARGDEPTTTTPATAASPWDSDTGPAATLDLDALAPSAPPPRTATPAPGPASAPTPARPRPRPRPSTSSKRS